MKLLFFMSILFVLTSLLVSTSAWYLSKLRKVTQKVIFDIEIDGRKQGRIVIGLFGETVPKTVEIFTELAKAKEGEGYKGSKFSSAISPYYITGGIITIDDGIKDGSIYRGLPNDENFALKHYSIGYVSVANSADSEDNGTEFVIYNTLSNFRDGNYVVFGKVLKGLNVIGKIAGNCGGTRSKDCVIADSEVVEVDEPFIAPV
ncbi:peptidyl-prolyl cis-trans isomerase 6-like isoform X2 [Ptychodera flava]|uniref:peptidyl-prolyl cis-trans isomerase 6-like isoform X2 n=1 Tax=Ptychodera flava TaxID=63121 RepID=UPI00396A9000